MQRVDALMSGIKEFSNFLRLLVFFSYTTFHYCV